MPATVASASAAAAAAASVAQYGDGGPPDWVNPAPCNLGDVPRTQYNPYAGLTSFIAATDEVKAKCGDGETHGKGSITVALGGACGNVRWLRFAEGPFVKGTKTSECILAAFQKISVHPFLGDDLKIDKAFVVP